MAPRKTNTMWGTPIADPFVSPAGTTRSSGGGVLGQAGGWLGQDDNWMKVAQLGLGAVGAAGQNSRTQANLQAQRQQNALNNLGNAYQGASNAYQNAANQEANWYTNTNADQRARAQAVAQLRPIGESQQYAASNAQRLGLLNALANGAGTVPTPGNPAIAKAMGSGFNVQSLLSPQYVSQMNRLLGDNATMASIAQRDSDISGVNPYAQTSPYAAMYGNQGMPYALQAALVANDNLSRYSDEKARAKGALDTAINNDIQNMQQYKQQAADAYAKELKAQEEKKKGGGFLGFLGSALKTAAPFAVAAIPGIGPVASAALLAGANAGGSLMQGQGLGGALASGALGAATSGLGRAVGTPSFIKSDVGKVAGRIKAY